jgi:hypothetical protein
MWTRAMDSLMAALSSCSSLPACPLCTRVPRLETPAELHLSSINAQQLLQFQSLTSTVPTAPCRPHPDDPEMTFCPKIILITSKDEVPPVFKALAMNLRAKTYITAAWADADSPAGEALLTQFKVGACGCTSALLGPAWCLSTSYPPTSSTHCQLTGASEASC